MQQLVSEQEKTQIKLSIARLLDDEKMSVISMNMRIIGGWIMSFFILCGVVLILFMMDGRLNWHQKFIVMYSGVAAIIFGILIGVIVTAINLYLIYKRVKKKIEKNYYGWYLKIFNSLKSIECSMLDDQSWMFDYKNDKFIINFDDKFVHFRISCKGKSVEYLNNNNIFNHNYNHRFDYVNYFSNVYYRKAIIKATNTFVNFALDDLQILVNEFEKM